MVKKGNHSMLLYFIAGLLGLAGIGYMALKKKPGSTSSYTSNGGEPEKKFGCGCG